MEEGLNWKDEIDVPVLSNSGSLAKWAEGVFARRAINSNKTIYEIDHSGCNDPEVLNSLKEELEDIIGTNIVHTYYSSEEKRSYYRHYVWEDGYITVNDKADDWLEVDGSTLDEEVFEKLINLFEGKLKPRASNKGVVYMLGKTMSGLELFNIGKGGVELNEDNYDDAVVKGYRRLVADLKSKSPSGRLGILSGPPGTGKTYLIRALLEEVSACFVMIPATMVDAIGSPDIIPHMLKIKESNKGYSIVFIIEDGDRVLLNRGMDNVSAISTLLNVTDGILGDLIDLRVIVTTNEKTVKVEPALLRPGRISARVDVGFINEDKAYTIYHKLMGNMNVAPVWEDRDKITLSTVYQKARENGWLPEGITEQVFEDADGCPSIDYVADDEKTSIGFH